MEQRFSDLILLLAGGINQRRMYFDAHPKVRAFSQDFTIQLGKLLAGDDQEEFSFGVFKGKFIRNGKYLVGPSIAGRSLIAFAELLGCGGFAFRLPLQPADVVAFFRLAATVKDPIGDLAVAQKLFAREGIGHIRLANPFVENRDGTFAEGTGEPGESIPQDDDLEDFSPLVDIYQSLYEIVARNNSMALHSGGLDIAGAMANGERLAGAGGDGVLDVMQFIRYPDYDSYTIGHSVRVGALAVVVGRRLGFPPEIVTELATAGLLHDLGKGRIPEEILFKPGRLEPDERRIMESHPALGAQVLIASGEATEMMVSAAWGHHIRQDGRGYPAMPDWHKPSFAAALIHVCDVFEALTATRPYKKPMSPHRAYEIMFRDRAAFDPRPLSALIQSLGLYPPGSEVVLTDGRRGVVARAGRNLDRPAVRLTRDQFDVPLARGPESLVDLERESSLGVAEVILVGAGES